MANRMPSTLMLCREAERLRWHLTGHEGGLQDTRFACQTVITDDEVVLYATQEKGRPFVKISIMAIHHGLEYVSERYIEPFVRELPSVKASAHAKAEDARARGEAEYNSWYPLAPVDTACGRA